MESHLSLDSRQQMEKYAHRRNVILGITKAHYNIVKNRSSNINCGNINAIAVEPTHALLYKGAIIANL